MSTGSWMSVYNDNRVCDDIATMHTNKILHDRGVVPVNLKSVNKTLLHMPYFVSIIFASRILTWLPFRLL